MIKNKNMYTKKTTNVLIQINKLKLKKNNININCML